MRNVNMEVTSLYYNFFIETDGDAETNEDRKL